MSDESSVKVLRVELRDLVTLLRKRLANPRLQLLDCSTESLLPLGENYGSTILKVHAKIRRNEAEDDVAEEELHLVAKMLPETDFQRRVFDSPFTFKKERFFYERLMPAYQQLERDFGVPEDRVFDVLPEFFGARYSLKYDGGNDDDKDQVVDDDAIILMQNLKAQGYYMADRRNGMDLEHGKATLAALARFHGLGMAMKHHRPDFFEIMKIRSKCLKIDNDNFKDCLTLLLTIFREDPVMSRYYEKLEAAIKQESATSWSAPPTEPWSTIVHADFWINNIMFRRDASTARISDVKFVDFQNYLFMSPLRELVFFLMANFQADVMESKFDDLIDFYYDEFIGTLKEMRCAAEPFTNRAKFDAQLKSDAYKEFPHCPFMLKIMTADIKNDAEKSDIKNNMMDMTINDLGRERLRRCVNKFVERGWLG